MKINHFWLIFGFTGQAAFFSRFFVQWIVSEIKKKSVIPTLFWYLSIIGSSMLLVYALHLKDPVFIAGHLFGFMVYSRNLYLVYRERRREAAR